MTNEDLKLEAIKKAYGEYWERFQKYINKDGWIGLSKYGFDEDYELEELFDKMILNNSFYSEREEERIYWRPRSLTGLETNRGWIRIEEDGSNLPKEEANFWFYTIHKKTVTNYYNPHYEITNRKKYLDAYTHYQPIIKPEPPLW